MTLRVELNKLYVEEFGRLVDWNHEQQIFDYPIDVMEYRDASDEFSVLATIGMCELAQPVPPEFVEYERCELYYCVREPSERHRVLLRHLAKFPFQDSRWFGHGHTWQNGVPPEPLFVQSQLCAVLLLDPMIASARAVCERMEVAERRLKMLWVVPIATAELELVRSGGFGTLLDLFDEHQHPALLDEKRVSYT